jgi:hypothetical protein
MNTDGKYYVGEQVQVLVNGQWEQVVIREKYLPSHSSSWKYEVIWEDGKTHIASEDEIKPI